MFTEDGVVKQGLPPIAACSANVTDLACLFLEKNGRTPTAEELKEFATPENMKEAEERGRATRTMLHHQHREGEVKGIAFLKSVKTRAPKTPPPSEPMPSPEKPRKMKEVDLEEQQRQVEVEQAIRRCYRRAALRFMTKQIDNLSDEEQVDILMLLPEIPVVTFEEWAKRRGYMK